MRTWGLTYLKGIPFFGLVLFSALAAEPQITIVFPAEGSRVSTATRSYVIGSVTPPETPLTINGATVTPWRTGGFLLMTPVSPGTNTLVCRAGTNEHRRTFTVPYPEPAWDGRSLRVQSPLQPLGVGTHEAVRLECLAPTGLTVCVSVGERTVTLTPPSDHATRYTGDVTFDAPAERVPVTFFTASLPDATGACLTARNAWPAQCVTGGLFEVRARTAPGEDDTVAFLPPGLCVQGAGFIGEHTRFWLAGNLRYVETRHLAPAITVALLPRDLPLPDPALGFGPHPPTNRPPSGFLIVLDPGHGGDASGAVGPRGIPEKQVTLQQASIIKHVLEQAGFRVRLTREDDTNPDLYERVRLAYTEKADAFVALHYNATVPATDPQSVRHIATYYWNTIGEQLARAIHPHVAAATPISDGGVRQASFAVCRNPAVPSILIELDFITVPEGEEAIQNPERQMRVAEAILAGLRDWLNPVAR